MLFLMLKKVVRHQSKLVLKGSITKITVFQDFWQIHPPETTPWASFNWGKTLKTIAKYSICDYLVSKVLRRKVLRYPFKLFLKGSISKIIVFCDFWQNLPPETTPWAPCSRVKSRKTTAKYLICVCLVSKVQKKCLDIHSSCFWRVQSQK